MDALNMIQEMVEKAKTLYDDQRYLIMNPSTAERLLEHFIGTKCNINYSCPKDNVYLVRDNSEFNADKEVAE